MHETFSKYGLVAVALVASLVGGSVGAFVSTRMAQPDPVAASPTTAPPATEAIPAPHPVQPPAPAAETQESELAATTAALAGDDDFEPARDQTTSRAATKAAPKASKPSRKSSARSSTRRVYYTSERQGSAPARSYYEYKKPSFWSRHRDVLTIAVGTGVGTAIGAVAGGGKGAAIGALAGGGGTGLYTLTRKRSRY